MIKSFTIFQLDNSKQANNFKFMPYDFVKKMSYELSLCFYNLVYQSEVVTSHDDAMDILDDLYFEFNMRKPADFKGHSLSTSDIIKMDNKYYYCDSFGFVEVKF
jgi:hypothetical protein